MEYGAARFFEPWCDEGIARERDVLYVTRLKRKKIQSNKESNAMQELESKVNKEKANMAIADALYRMRVHNAMREQLLDPIVHQEPRTRKDEWGDTELTHEAFVLKRKHEEEKSELEVRETEEK